MGMALDRVVPRDAMMRMVNSYRVSQAVHVAAVLGLADLLGEGPGSAEELAEATGTQAASLYRLLRALAGVGIFAEVDGRFQLTPLGECLQTDAPGSVRAWAIFIGREYHWTSWGHLLESIRTGQPAFPQLYGTTAWEYRTKHPEEDAIFNAAMTSLSAGAVDAVVRSYDFSSIGVLIDVGGGEGSLLMAILLANPILRGILFDQPHVVASAAARLQHAGLAERCEIVGGSFFESIPAGADAYLLKSIVHDWDDTAVIAILQRCREAVADNGKLLVVEPVIRAGKEPDPAKVSDLNMLVMLGGRERTAEDFERLYAAAGFELTHIVPTGSGFSVIEGMPA